MKVKIVKCSAVDYWYAQKVGSVFDVVDFRIVVESESPIHRLVPVNDCEIVEEENEIENEFVPFKNLIDRIEELETHINYSPEWIGEQFEKVKAASRVFMEKHNALLKRVDALEEQITEVVCTIDENENNQSETDENLKRLMNVSFQEVYKTIRDKENIFDQKLNSLRDEFHKIFVSKEEHNKIVRKPEPEMKAVELRTLFEIGTVVYRLQRISAGLAGFYNSDTGNFLRKEASSIVCLDIIENKVEIEQLNIVLGALYDWRIVKEGGD